MGLVQLFWDVPCPDLLARHLLQAVLADFRETGHHRLFVLTAERNRALCEGGPEEFESISKQIHEHALYEQIPQRWQLDFFFSPEALNLYGDRLYLCAFWASALIHICTLEQYWRNLLFGYRPDNPNLLVGFHREEDVYDPSWLDEFRQVWSTELKVEILGTETFLEVESDGAPMEPGQRAL